jgi:hypothetical protein
MPLLLKLPLIAAVALAITLGLPRTLVQLSLPITDKANQTAEHPKSEKKDAFKELGKAFEQATESDKNIIVHIHTPT